MSAPLPGDKAAGYWGLVVASAFLLLVLGGIVKWTNIQFAGHGPAAAHAPAAGQSPAAAPGHD